MSLGFLIKVALISSSGALAPGPLTAATAAIGIKRGWRGGLWISAGHAIVELPLVVLIGLGVTAVLTSKEVTQALSLIGGSFLIFFAYLTARDAIKVKSITTSNPSASPLLIGISLSALNPFFIAWWVGVGSPLVMEAVRYWGFAGIGFLYAAHVWLDFAWLITLARITSLSGFSLKLYKILLFALVLLVALFGIDFIYYAFKENHLLPF